MPAVNLYLSEDEYSRLLLWAMAEKKTATEKLREIVQKVLEREKVEA